MTMTIVSIVATIVLLGLEIASLVLNIYGPVYVYNCNTDVLNLFSCIQQRAYGPVGQT